MILKDVVQWLLSESYAVIVNQQLVFTKKCQDELGIIEVPKIEEALPTVAPKQLEKARPKVDLKDIWSKFVTDAEIPWRVGPIGRVYTVRQYSKGAAAALVQAINKADYKMLVESTKNYYRTVSYAQTLGNYLTMDTWKHEYDEWVKRKGTILPTQGSNPFEI